MRNEIMTKLESSPKAKEWWILINKKYKKSLFIYTTLNVVVIALTSLLMITNLIAILNLNSGKTNSSVDHTWEWKYLLTITIITSISGLLTTVMSIFKFKVRSRNAKEAIKEIKQEYKVYKAKKDKYYNNPTRDQLFLETVSEISFIEN